MKAPSEEQLADMRKRHEAFVRKVRELAALINQNSGLIDEAIANRAHVKTLRDVCDAELTMEGRS